MNINYSLGSVFNYLERFMKTDTVIGQPVQIGELTLIPIISILIGAGGGGEDKIGNRTNPKTSAGLGGGARITVDAVILIRQEEISVIPVRPEGTWGKAMELAQSIINSLKSENKEGVPKDNHQ